jgi:uncharacterized repeat protein (TIGR02543 family)
MNNGKRKMQKGIIIIVIAQFFLLTCENPIQKAYFNFRNVTYNSNGGSSVATQRLMRDDKITQPANPSKANHTFDGWYEDNNTFAKRYDFSKTPQSDLTLYAKWNANGTNPDCDHVYGAWVITKPATASEDGEETRTCTKCGHQQKRTIPATGDPDCVHVFGNWQIKTPATCTDAGEQERHCTLCPKTEIEPIPATGHDWDTWHVTTHATCTDKGEETRYCKHDSTHKETRETAVDPDAHDWEAQAGSVAPTCTTEGNGTIKCKHCGKTETADVIPKLDHVGEWKTTKPATCTDTGMEEERCIHCNDLLDIKTIPILGHLWGTWTQTLAPTCSAVGKETRTCSRDTNHTETRDIAINTNTHNWGNWIVTSPADCETAEKQERVCTYDSTHKEQRTVGNPLGHDMEWVVTTPATTTTEGEETYKCQRIGCNYIEGTRSIPKIPVSTNDFADYLATLNPNDNPHYIKLNVDNTTGLADALKDNLTIHVILDLSDSNLDDIPDNAFQDCTNLVGIALPDGIKSFGQRAFQNTGLTSIIIPDGFTTFGNNAFRDCTRLTSIVIPASVTRMGTNSFTGCTNLTSVTFEGTIYATGWVGAAAAFNGDLRAKFYEIDGGYGTPGMYTTTAPVTTSAVWTKKYAGEVLTSGGELGAVLAGLPANDKDNPHYIKLTMTPLTGAYNTAGSVGNALADINNKDKYITLDLSDCTFNSNTIQTTAFRDGVGLVEVILPNTLNSIGVSAFIDCTNLESVTFPNNINFTSIGNAAFQGCESLTSVTIPNSVTTLGNNAFDGCKSLTSIIIPAKVTSIGALAFRGCTGLTSITIENGVQGIGNSAFSGCTSLTSVIIPTSVTSIGTTAFGGCTYLASVTFERADTNITSANAFPGTAAGATLKALYDDATNGGIGTYIRTGTPPFANNVPWTKEP